MAQLSTNEERSPKNAIPNEFHHFIRYSGDAQGAEKSYPENEGVCAENSLRKLEIFDEVLRTLVQIRVQLTEMLTLPEDEWHLRGGGNDRKLTRRNSEQVEKDDDRLNKLMKKIEKIESKLKFLIAKLPPGTSHDSCRKESTEKLRRDIEAFQKKLSRCEEKRKRYNEDNVDSKRRMEVATNSPSKKSDSGKEVSRSAFSNVAQSKKADREVKYEKNAEKGQRQDSEEILSEATKSSRQRDAKTAKASHKRRRFQDNSEIQSKEVVRNVYNFHTGDASTEDQMCLKMHNAAFQKFGLRNMGFIYNRYLTARYYQSGVLEYIEIENDKKEKKIHTRLNFPMGPFFKNKMEVRFKRLEPYQWCHMVYYSYRRGQQLVDRIVSETWKEWFPKRFYMPMDYFEDSGYKKNPPKIDLYERENLNDPKIHEYIPNLKFVHSHIISPVCIPIPNGTKRKVFLVTAKCWSYVGETGFHCVDYYHLLARYNFGKSSIYQRKKQPPVGNLWLDVFLFKNPVIEQRGIIAAMYVGEVARSDEPYVRSHPQAGWSGDLVQGFNVKRLDNLMATDTEFSKIYEKWGKIHPEWDIANKRRSDAARI